MKRFLSVVLFFGLIITITLPTKAESALLSVGSSFMLGQYEQDNKTDTGKEPIEWLVLAIEDGKALLLSRYALDFQAYHQSKDDETWENSNIRAWLNSDFLNQAFSAAEQAAILVANVSNASTEGHPEWQTIGGNNTKDKVFLLSYAETNAYFGKQDAKKSFGTEYANSLGAKYLIFNETEWWLRSSGKVQYDAMFIDRGGAPQSNAVNNKKAIRPALWLDLTVSQDLFTASLYSAATELLNDGKYEDAALAFDKLGTYSNSSALAIEARYLFALEEVRAGNYAFAIELFGRLGKYKDSYEQARESRYLQAVAVQENGDLEEAIKLLGTLGQYKDSMSRLKECFSSLGISMYYTSQDTINAGIDSGYSKKDKLTVNDAHFGWRLGRFLMSGFTRVSEGTNNVPIFIKTLGDKVTLWFDLEQDINRLNGNDNLVISEDVNGYDEYFGVARTNFGHGALIVRHKDYQNALGDPVLYTDYLAAKESFGADTKVELFEEGDYEIALNYETVSKTYGVLSNYSNYRITFSFSVRNGNTMIFPFDVVTGAELANSTITANGFYLDLAKSRYLDINIKRSVLTEGASGLTEDQRFNRPAKDGDRYTQEGIYTITVQNRYTGEETVKQLFVGTEELLKKYEASGLTIDKN